MGISTDGSMGARVTLTGPTFTIPASLGTQPGGNLFHSFSEFNLLQGETADFTGTGATAPIHNIIARVTGGDPSSIDGTVQCDIAGANLFLLNPAGVIFGVHAQVNVTGAFTAGTASYVTLADGTGKFNTSLGGSDVLTSADVSAFGFLGNPAPVQFMGSQLTLPSGSRFSVAGGDLTLNGSTLTSPGGHISIFSAGGAGTVAYNPASSAGSFGATSVTNFGAVTMQNGAKTAIDGAISGGAIVIRGGKIVMQGGSKISAINSSGAIGGDINVSGDSLLIQNASSIETQSTGGGGAGSVAVNIAKALELDSGGTIASVTSASGAAGNVAIAAATLTVDGIVDPAVGSVAAFTGIASDCTPGSAGPGGSLTLNVAGAITLRNGGSIDSDTAGSGDAGAVNVHAGSILIGGGAANAASQFTGISSTADAGSTGAGGVLHLDVTHDITVLAGGEIQAATFAAGPAGEIDISAHSMQLDGTLDPNVLTGVTSNAEASSSNDGGLVQVNLTAGLLCTGGAGINSQTFASGRGGDVTVDARGIVSLDDGGYVAADTYGAGHGGAVSVSASSITIDGAGSAGAGFLTGISSLSQPASSGPSGDGGTVVVQATNSLQLIHAGQISATASVANAGNILITAGQDVSLVDGGAISTSAGDNGGSITLRAGRVLFVVDSSLTSAANGGAGTDGGNITIDPQFVALDNGVISANDPGGTGGNITIVTDDFLNSASSITATGATNGVINISSPDLDLGNSLAALPIVTVDDSQRLRESCARTAGHELSTLIVVGRGGTEIAPDELTPDFGDSDYVESGSAANSITR